MGQVQIRGAGDAGGSSAADVARWEQILAERMRNTGRSDGKRVRHGTEHGGDSRQYLRRGAGARDADTGIRRGATAGAERRELSCV